MNDADVFTVVLGAVLSNDRAVSYAADLNLATGRKYVAYEANTTSTVTVGADSIAFKECGKWDFQVWAIAPVLANSGSASGWTLLGEQSKWVPVSAARFSELGYGTCGVVVVVVVVGQTTPLAFNNEEIH